MRLDASSSDMVPRAEFSCIQKTGQHSNSIVLRRNMWKELQIMEIVHAKSSGGSFDRYHLFRTR